MSAVIRSLLALTLLLSQVAATAQDYRDSTATEKEKVPEAPRPWKDRIWFGGGLGLSFGSVTNIAIEPMVGYKLTKNGKLSAGIGISYQYFRSTQYVPTIESSNYGGRLFTRYRIIEQLFAHAEYYMLNTSIWVPLSNGDYRVDRQWVPFLLLGGGYSARLGGNTYLTAMVLFDVIQDVNSPYSGGEPWISAGVGFGF